MLFTLQRQCTCVLQIDLINAISFYALHDTGVPTHSLLIKEYLPCFSKNSILHAIQCIQ